MQQTTKYQLNLIETSDLFSAAPLNENAQKLEAALDTKVDTAQAAAAHAALADSLNGEAAARAAGDAALADSLNGEAAARADGDAAEAQARINADAAEAQARVNADAALDQARVNGDAAEAQARAAGDAAEANARANGDAALEQRIISLEGKHAVGGMYIGSGGTQFIDLGFTPECVLIFGSSSSTFYVFHRNKPYSGGYVGEGGFYVANAGISFSASGGKYVYIAIG